MSLDRDGIHDAVAAVRSGDPRALGRLISWIENASPALPMIMKELAPDYSMFRMIVNVVAEKSKWVEDL